MHVYEDLMRCKSVCDVKSRIDPRPFSLGHVPNDAYFFVNLEAYKKPMLGKKRTKKGAMLSQQVQRFILAKKVFWG